MMEPLMDGVSLRLNEGFLGFEMVWHGLPRNG